MQDIKKKPKPQDIKERKHNIKRPLEAGSNLMQQLTTQKKMQEHREDGGGTAAVDGAVEDTYGGAEQGARIAGMIAKNMSRRKGRSHDAGASPQGKPFDVQTMRLPSSSGYERKSLPGGGGTELQRNDILNRVNNIRQGEKPGNIYLPEHIILKSNIQILLSVLRLILTLHKKSELISLLLSNRIL